MSVATVPLPRTAMLAMAGPIAIGGILAARLSDPTPLVTAPAIVFGVLAATGPALYIATAATGQAPPLTAVLRAFVVALGAFGIVLAGLVLPAAFLSLTSTSPMTTFLVTSLALAAAGVIGLRRLASELATKSMLTASSWLVFGVWSLATVGIAGRLWWDFAAEVMS